MREMGSAHETKLVRKHGQLFRYLRPRRTHTMCHDSGSVGITTGLRSALGYNIKLRQWQSRCTTQRRRTICAVDYAQQPQQIRKGTSWTFTGRGGARRRNRTSSSCGKARGQGRRTNRNDHENHPQTKAHYRNEASNDTSATNKGTSY